MKEGIDTSGNTIPLWFLDCKLPAFPKLKANISTNICIIGGGIAGLTTAYKLCLEGKAVVLIDDGNLASGESSRTTGHLCSALDDRFYDLEKIYGKNGAKRIAESHSTAIDFIEKIIKTESIDCDFKRVNGYLFLDQNDKLETLKKEEKAATRAGVKVKLLLDANINEFKLGPALKFYDQAKFHPLKYLAALSQAIVKRGGKIFTFTHASDIKSGNKIQITTADNYKINADNLIITTNAPVLDKAMIFAKQEANRTYVIGVSLKDKHIDEDALFWDTGDPYHYLRFQSVGDKKKKLILIVGGEDHRTGKKIDKNLFRRLENWTKKIIPQSAEVKYRWSGQILEPFDDLAFMGINPTKEKNIFVATGFSGNGLTHGTIAALLITDQIMGRKNPWREIYNPSRKKMSKIHSFISNNLSGASRLIKYLTPGEISNVKQVKKDEGAVIRKGLHKIAVYRDVKGKLHQCSAVCPHMKGLVTWNNVEKSWDCPLHGSRFTPFGEVMNGPANANLEKESESK